MNILIFSQYYDPEQFLINDIAPELVELGHSVTVVTGLPNYPSGVIPEEYRKGKRRHQSINGVQVIRCPILPRGRNKIQLLANYLSYMVLANRAAGKLKTSFDIVFCYQLTPVLQACPAIWYAKRHHLKLMMYNLDLAPMSGSMFLKKWHVLSVCYRKLSKWIMNSCDHIAVTSKSFIDYNHTVNNVPKEKMTYLPQHASKLMLDVNMETEENGIADFMFAGNIGKGTGLDVLVEAAEKLRHDCAFKIHIVGDGSYLPTLKEKVKAYGLSDFFIFYGRHSMQEMPKFYRLADALLITLREGQIAIPGKLQTYMTTKKPIFGAMDGAGKDIIEESECGVCVSAGDHEALYQTMKAYIENPKRFERCGVQGLSYFKNNFTLEIFMERLNEILLTIAEK